MCVTIHSNYNTSLFTFSLLCFSSSIYFIQYFFVKLQTICFAVFSLFNMKVMNEPMQLLALLSFCSIFFLVASEDPYRFFDWTITYGDIYPLGVKQQVYLT